MWILNLLPAAFLVLNLVSLSFGQSSFSCYIGFGVGPSCDTVDFSPSANSAAQTVTFNAGNFNNLQVTSLSVTYPSKLNYLPIAFFDIFPNLNSFLTGVGSLTTLVADNFGNCSQLNYLQLYNTSITTLPNGFASKCSLLNNVNIYQGQLTTIEPNAFQGLSSLRSVMLINNQITCIPPTLFSYSPNITSIMLSNNKIASLDPSTFAGFSMLTSIMLDNNYITAVPAMQFTTILNSGGNINLVLYNNPITSIDPSLLNIFPAQNADFYFTAGVGTNPYPTCIPTGISSQAIHKDNYLQVNASYSSCYTAWKGNPVVPCALTTTTSSTRAPNGTCPSDKICRFYLDYMNRYVCVLDGVDSIITSITGTHISPLFTDASVTAVYFTNSVLSRVSPILFSTFPNLQFLSVANCSLGVVNDFTFTQCGSNLKKIDLSYNGIFHITDTALKYCTGLQVLDLTGNPLDYVSSALYKYDPALQTIILSKV